MKGRVCNGKGESEKQKTQTWGMDRPLGLGKMVSKTPLLTPNPEAGKDKADSKHEEKQPIARMGW